MPSRGRPDNLRRVIDSARSTAVNDIQFVIYLDNDDVMSHSVARELCVDALIGPRILLSQMWNECWAHAKYDIAMHCGDDIIFQSPRWDTLVIDAFNLIPDRIALVHGRDGIHDQHMATHGFLHRTWVNTLGYFVPPYFASDYNDLWLTEVADAIGRRVFLADVFTEHMHPVVGKGPMDQTHHDRLTRHSQDDCDNIWRNTAHLRVNDINKLKAVIHG